CQQNNSNPLTF
nr:immunoglobulin light chain junction region [Macaca mulatta]